MDYSFYKQHKTDTIFWVDNVDSIGEHLFTFDKKKIYNIFADYPQNLSAEEKAIFDKENPFWCNYLKGRDKIIKMVNQLCNDKGK